ncbi:Imidazoleglycerol-phosphate dehydratase [Koleobacter methoxysyntrophicus]|uniref:Imidazoleglycerol-phosphate dehydratase n=1 Tax=Koleobacter methoxysyntrophicus TaxID=2751313 RepID=A0A8A0RQ24_9FIRM|nr:imidazoleglycerol-phosphate dehydratase HisB [Koleobacter methoxysyntrophicus]QSQ09619.1 Imidazoleglycerol-phosphate dehydratase [Koleobacter methoxysyntrophicus]
MVRKGEIHRKTGETEIKVNMNLDGEGIGRINTPIPFLNHMLELFAKHSLFDLELTASGDVEVDFHHTVEDIGICLGKAFNKALGDKKGIKRFCSAFIPMDEALILLAADISGRPFLKYDVNIPAERVGNFDTELVEEFFRAFVNSGNFTLHVRLIEGKNAHHIIEAVFKALGRVLSGAVELDSRIKGVPSTKGIL